MSEAMLKLRARKEAVQLGHMGLVTLNKPPYISGQVYQECVKFVVAQCLLDGIASTEEGLCIRGLNPVKDLLWGQNEEHMPGFTQEWRQPIIRVINNNVVAEGYDKQRDGILFPPGNMLNAYRTNRDVDNDMHVITFLGVQNVNPDGECWVDRIEFRRGHVKIITELDLSLISSRGIVFCQSPVLYKRGDNALLRFYLKNGYEGKHDNLVPIGIVGEAIGQNFTG